MKKYMAVSIPNRDEDDEILSWWRSEDLIRIIEILEEKYPDFVFHQVVTTVGTGGHPEFILMKLK
jgi:hypothetical protein